MTVRGTAPLAALAGLVMGVTLLASCTSPTASSAPLPPTTVASVPTSIGSVNSAPDQGCTIKLTGAVTGSIHAADGPGTAASDYWLSPAEQAATGSVGPLVLTCTNGVGTISVASADGTSPAQMPFGPGRYSVGPDVAKGAIVVVAMIGNQPYDARRGTLEVTHFDTSTVEGTIALDLVSSSGTGQVVQAQGGFVVSCQGITVCRP
jgi:hypothetical protein